MEHHEMAEKLVEKCGISYEEAGNVLKEANFDMLEAMIILERRGMLNNGSQNRYSTGIMQNYHSAGEKNAFDAESVKEFIHIAWNKILEIIKDIIKYNVVVKKHGAEIFRIPMLVTILIICLFNFLIIPAIIVGLVLECSIEIKK